MDHRKFLPVVVAASLLAAACSSSDANETSDAGDVTIADTVESVPTTTAPAATVPAATDGYLTTIDLITDQAEPFDRVELTGLEPSAVVGALGAVASSPEGDYVYVAVYHDATGPFIFAPIHPEGGDVTGPVTLRFTDGDEFGPEHTLEVAALPEAEGAWSELVTDAIASIDAQAQQYGHSFTDLQAADASTLAGPLAALKSVQVMLDDGTDIDLESLPSHLPAEQATILDSLVASFDLATLLPAAPSGIQGFRSVPAATPMSFPQPVPRQVACLDLGPDVDTAEQLVDALALGRDATVTPGGAEEQVLASIDAAVSAASDLPEPYNSLIGGIGMIFSAIRYAEDIVAGIYPTSLDRITAELTKTEFNEDFTEDGAVQNVMVTASSRGYDGHDLLGDLASMVFDKAKSAALGRLSDEDQELINEFEEDLGEIQDFQEQMAEQLAIETTNQYIEKLKQHLKLVCPKTWDVPLNSSTYVTIDAVIGRLDVDESAFTYKPNQLGGDTLRVGANPDAFPGQAVFAETEIAVHQLQVHANPETVYVARPGDPVQITAELEYADTTTLYWNPKNGSWGDGIGDDTNEPMTRSYNTSSVASDYENGGYVIHVDSTSTTGLRENATDVRTDTVVVKLSEIEIIPNPGSVLVNEQIGFAAVDRNGEPVTVDWEATGGQIASNGLYTAGDEAGTYTVTATLRGDPDVVATAVVNVGDAACILGDWELDLPAFMSAMNAYADDGGVSYVSGTSQVIVRPDGTSTWRMNDVTMKVTSEGETFTLVWSGESNAQWALEGGNFVTSTSTNSWSFYVVEFDQGINFNSPSAFGGAATYDCEPRETLTVYTAEGDTLHLTYNGAA